MNLQVLERPTPAPVGAAPAQAAIPVLLRLWGVAEQAVLAKRTATPPARQARGEVQHETVRYATD